MADVDAEQAWAGCDGQPTLALLAESIAAAYPFTGWSPDLPTGWGIDFRIAA